MKELLSSKTYPEEMSNELAKIIDEIYLTQKNIPTDNIRINVHQSREIVSLFSLDVHYENIYDEANDPEFLIVYEKPIPADILFADTIPIRNCRIERPDDDIWGQGDGLDSLKYSANVHTFDKIKLNSTDMDIHGDAYLIGLADITINIIRRNKIFRFIYPMVIEVGNSSLRNDMSFGLCDDADEDEFLQWTDEINGLGRMAFSVVMRLWYTAQVALLHPVIKEHVRVRDSVIKSTNRHNKSKKKNHPVKYVKEYIINDDTIKAICNYRKNTRHAQCWYVIGHWRTYSSGKKIFIKPHWRGPLRHLKTPEETHERNLVVEGGET